MVAPRKVSREQLRDDPYIAWNEYVDILAMSDYRELTETQRAAYLVFWYENEVQNGGHLQYFENFGATQVQEVIAALRRLDAHCQSNVLCQAAALFAANPRPELESVEKYVNEALAGEFDAFDQAFHRCQPPLSKALEAFLELHRSEFVVVVD